MSPSSAPSSVTVSSVEASSTTITSISESGLLAWTERRQDKVASTWLCTGITNEKRGRSGVGKRRLTSAL